MPRYHFNLQYISSPRFYTHIQLLQITCSLIIMAQELYCSLAKERQDCAQTEKSGMAFFLAAQWEWKYTVGVGFWQIKILQMKHEGSEISCWQ